MFDWKKPALMFLLQKSEMKCEQKIDLNSIN